MGTVSCKGVCGRKSCIAVSGTAGFPPIPLRQRRYRTLLDLLLKSHVLESLLAPIRGCEFGRRGPGGSAG
jgi:hypothetical protein